MVEMNVFRVLADLCHFASKCILIWAIHWNRSAEGVSLITQTLYLVVFVTRYLDLFWVPPWFSYWLFILKNFYIWSSLYIIVLMMRVFARTREREAAWKLGSYATIGSLVAAPLVTLIFRGTSFTTFSEVLWTFSIILESVCVLPQLLLLRQTTVPTVIDSFYLLTLGSYRGLYILNWIVRAAGHEHHFDPISVIFGIVQTALYIDFAWVYWTRQRVKLRGGGIVDSEDLRKGWLVNRVLGNNMAGAPEDEESQAIEGHDEAERGNPPRSNRWGTRGVSISADDTLHDHPSRKKSGLPSLHGIPEESQGMLQDEDTFISGEDIDDDAEDFDTSAAHSTVLNSDEAWDEQRRAT